jgi:hypothetical protein
MSVIQRVTDKLTGRGREIAWSIASLATPRRETGVVVYWPSTRHRPRVKAWLDPLRAGLARQASIEDLEKIDGRNRHLAYARIEWMA